MVDNYTGKLMLNGLINFGKEREEGFKMKVKSDKFG